MENFNEKIPEFEVFKRIENLEKRILKDLTDQDIKDMALIALNSIELSFMVYRTCRGPKISRIMKDSILDTLDQEGLSKSSLNMLDELLTYICDIRDE